MCKTGKKINKINFNEFLFVLLENEKNYIYIYILWSSSKWKRMKKN